MLNEIQEFDHYLSGNRKELPLYNDTAKDNFTGIRRPLQVLARGFLEKCKGAGLPPLAAVAACKGFLYTWMTGELSDALPNDLPSQLLDICQLAAKNSFMQFVNHVSKTDRTEKVREKAKEAMQSPYYKAALSKKNDFNKIRFDYIIADAIYTGPLQAYYLALKDDKKDKADKPYGIGGSEKERKIALAVVAHYLQQRARIGNDPQREFIPTIQPEIGNWVHVRAQRSGNKRKDGSETPSVAGAIAAVTVSKTGEPLLEKISSGNNTKVRVNTDWLLEYRVQLIPEDKVDAYREQGFCIITDAELLLKKNRK